jgi:hypothetical protein
MRGWNVLRGNLGFVHATLDGALSGRDWAGAQDCRDDRCFQRVRNFSIFDDAAAEAGREDVHRV